MAVMTIGILARRTGVPVKALREYEDAGLIYTVGRSAGNYRLFDDEALWCVGVIMGLRALGVTVAEIREFVAPEHGGEPTGPKLAALLQRARARTNARIVDLQHLLERIDQYEEHHRAELAGDADLRAGDPRYRRR